MKNILVIYHGPSCLDGFAAAYAAWLKLGTAADYIPAQYGDQPPNVDGKEVYILDFSYPRETLTKMYSRSKNLLVLDHHAGAQEALADLLYATFDMERSGCAMAWDHFHPEVPMPWAFKWIQDRDLWRWKYGDDTRAFTMAMASLIPFTFEAWLEALAEEGETLESGLVLLAEYDRDISRLLTRKHVVCLLGKHVGLAVNAPPKYSSELGNKLAQLSGTFGLTYTFDGSHMEWQYSIRSCEGFDVLDIARSFGGGGHKKASGWSSPTLLEI